MPVPKTVETSPRKLLRDIVFEQLLTAIEDGTLEPGERLNDEELEKWLGVSRTPIREAISKLADIGLVETAPQRYTRVAKPTAEQYAEALRLLNGFHELSARWSIPQFTDEDVAAFRELGDAVLADIEARDKHVLRSSSAFADFMVERSGNSLLQQVARQMNTRRDLHLPPDDRLLPVGHLRRLRHRAGRGRRGTQRRGRRARHAQAGEATDAFLEQVVAAGGGLPAAS